MTLNGLDWFLIENWIVAFSFVAYFAIRAERAEWKLEQRKNRRIC